MKLKSKGTAYAIWLFLGLFGGHRFYVGDNSKGLLMLITFGGFGIWWLLDFLSVGKMVKMYNLRFGAGHGNYNHNNNNNNNVNTNTIVVNVNKD